MRNEFWSAERDPTFFRGRIALLLFGLRIIDLSSALP
jgi:hypothetical protein